jgi:hypothetical protein
MTTAFGRLRHSPDSNRGDGAQLKMANGFFNRERQAEN